MGAMPSQIIRFTTVYSSVYSGADQRNHQSSASLAFLWGIHRWPVNSPHKWPVTRKNFSVDDVVLNYHCLRWYQIKNGNDGVMTWKRYLQKRPFFMKFSCKRQLMRNLLLPCQLGIYDDSWLAFIKNRHLQSGFLETHKLWKAYLTWYWAMSLLRAALNCNFYFWLLESLVRIYSQLLMYKQKTLLMKNQHCSTLYSVVSGRNFRNITEII